MEIGKWKQAKSYMVRPGTPEQAKKAEENNKKYVSERKAKTLKYYGLDQPGPLENKVNEGKALTKEEKDYVKTNPYGVTKDAYKNIKVQNPIRNNATYDDYDFDMSEAYAVVSWSSNPAVHAILQGVPAFVGPSSLAYDVAQHNVKQINNPIRPDRTQWLNDLAHTEYSTHEIAAGIPLKHLTSKL